MPMKRTKAQVLCVENCCCSKQPKETPFGKGSACHWAVLDIAPHILNNEAKVIICRNG